MSEPPVQTRQLTRAEYDGLIEAGFFQPEDRVELLGGVLVVKEPQGGPHYTATRLVEEALRRVFGAGWDVRGQGPVALDDESEPEPDVAVVRGSIRDYRDHHPALPVLIVEIAYSSLDRDRGRKGSLYARAGLAEYWILDLVGRRLEVYRGPGADAAAAFGWRYRDLTILTADASVTPLAAPGQSIRVADLLP
jgi:Uma2 family endonuclease